MGAAFPLAFPFSFSGVPPIPEEPTKLLIYKVENKWIHVIGTGKRIDVM